MLGLKSGKLQTGYVIESRLLHRPNLAVLFCLLYPRLTAWRPLIMVFGADIVVCPLWTADISLLCEYLHL